MRKVRRDTHSDGRCGGAKDALVLGHAEVPLRPGELASHLYIYVLEFGEIRGGDPIRAGEARDSRTFKNSLSKEEKSIGAGSVAMVSMRKLLSSCCERTRALRCLGKEE